MGIYGKFPKFVQEKQAFSDGAEKLQMMRSTSLQNEVSCLAIQRKADRIDYVPSLELTVETQMVSCDAVHSPSKAGNGTVHSCRFRRQAHAVHTPE